MIKKQRTECYKQGRLTVINGDTLASDEEFLSEDNVKDGCNDNCSAKSICITAIQKLKLNNFSAANVLLNTILK